MRTGGDMPARTLIHEAGLFQGRLGFSKAILLLRTDVKYRQTSTASLILGFPKDCIRATFADVLAVLDKEVGQRPTGVK